MRNSKYFRLLTVLFKSIQIYFKNAQKAEHTFNIKCLTKFSTFQNFYHCQNFEIQISTFIKVKLWVMFWVLKDEFRNPVSFISENDQNWWQLVLQIYQDTSLKLLAVSIVFLLQEKSVNFHSEIVTFLRKGKQESCWKCCYLMKC